MADHGLPADGGDLRERGPDDRRAAGRSPSARADEVTPLDKRIIEHL